MKEKTRHTTSPAGHSNSKEMAKIFTVDKSTPQTVARQYLNRANYIRPHT